MERNRKLKTINGESIIGSGNIEIIGGGGHTHTNKVLLDTYTQTEVNLSSAVSLKHSNANDHTHSNTTALNNVSGVNTGDQDLSGKANTVHTHAISDVTNLQTGLDGKEPVITKNNAFNKNYGTAIDTVCQGNDTRLTDSRTPLAHTHVKSEITDFTHTHPQSDITNLVTALSGKEPANANIQAHVISAHAPSNAQANADITKAEIEAKLTGVITSHSHAGGSVPRTADGTYAGLANDTLAQNYAVNKVTKLTVTGARTLTTTVPPAGSEAMTIILTAGTSSFVITFGTGFKPVSTLATGTTSGRVFVIHWISDGTNLYENG